MIEANATANAASRTSAAVLVKEGSDEIEGRYKKMRLELPQPIPEAKLKAVLDATGLEFSQRPQPERLENFDSQLAADTQTEFNR